MFGGADGERLKDMAARAPTVGVADVVDPALDAGIEFGIADLAGVIGGELRPQPSVGRAHLARLDEAMSRIDDEAEPRDPRADRQHLSARFVDDEPQPGKPLDYRRLPD